jgi:hypothetical protein
MLPPPGVPVSEDRGLGLRAFLNVELDRSGGQKMFAHTTPFLAIFNEPILQRCCTHGGVAGDARDAPRADRVMPRIAREGAGGLLAALLYNERIDKMDERIGKRDLTPGAKAELEGPRPAAPKVPHRPPPPPKTQEKRWSKVEEAILASLVDVHGDGSWDLVAAKMRSRSSASVARHWSAMRSPRRKLPTAKGAAPSDVLTSSENEQTQQGADRSAVGTWLQHGDRESDGSDLIGLGGQKKALPEGWTETVHEAPARSYSTFAGPTGQRARSIAEAWRMHNAAGGGGAGGAGGAAVTGGSGVALDASSVSAQSARLAFLPGEASWASGAGDEAFASGPAIEYIPSHCVALSHDANVPAYATVVVTAEEID